VSPRLIVAVLLSGSIAFSGALALGAIARDDGAPSQAGGVPPVPLNLESSTTDAESGQGTAGLPTLAPRGRWPKPDPIPEKPRAVAPARPAPSVPSPTPSAPSVPSPTPAAPVIVAPAPAPTPTPAPTPAPQPPAAEPPVHFLNSG
jgi:outer membrane biosynthesis protein TonB